MAERFVGSDVQFFACDESGERKNTAAQSFAQHKHVGNDVVVFASEHPSGAAKPGRNFIEDKQRAVFVAGGADAFPVVERRNERRAPNGLADDSRHITFFFEDIFNVVGTGEIAGIAAANRAVAMVRRRDAFAASQTPADAAAKNGLAANGNSVERSAMKRIPHRNEFVSSRGEAREL